MNNNNAKVRRANSAKVSNVTIKASRNSNLKQSSQAKRSLSQPSDLDVILCESKMMNNLDDIKHIDDDVDDDDDVSDTDSLSSNHDDQQQQQQLQKQGVVYAEALYPFDAGGPRELSFEKGMLVEVIKRESGPWWYGRLKFDAIVNDNELEVHNGWFPKDFVKIIPTYGTNRKITIHQQASDLSCDIHPPSSAAPTISSSHSSSEIMKDNVIKELLETEINYVKLLNSLVNG